MEAVGYAQSESEATVSSVQSAETFDDFLSDDEFDAIFAAADKERSTEPTPDNATNDDKQEQLAKTAERDVNRQETISKLLDHFGSQEFKYTDKYKGTVTEMIAMCPAIDSVLNEGFEYVRDWLEPHKVTQEKPAEDDEKNKEGELTGESETDADIDTQVKTTDKPDEVARNDEKKAPVSKEVPLNGNALIEKVVEKQQPTKKETIAEATPLAVSAILPETETELKTETEPKSGVSAVRGESLVITLDSEEKVEEAQPPLITEPVSMGALSEEQGETPVEERGLEKDVAESTVIDSVDETIPEEIQDSGDAFIKPVTVDFTEVLETETEAEVEVEHLKTVPVTEGDAIDYFDTWREIAEDEPPLDDLFINIADKLEAKIAQDEEQSSVEDEFISHHHLEVSDEELVLSKQPEVFAIYTAIRSTRKSVEALYTARTKEECKFYVEQIVEELTIVLRSLGYDNPEVMIRAFLSSHSPESLKNLITELENSLRRTMVYEIQQKRTGHVKNRRARLTKFVGFIMQALVPSSVRVDTQLI